jgi:adenylylsulfate kinase
MTASTPEKRMTTVKCSSKEPFAIWVTGLPASGKSTLVSALRRQLDARGVHLAVLESDVLRKVFTPQPRYDEQERDLFYTEMIYVGALLIEHTVSVIFDATANRRAYRNAARAQIPKFLEVYVDCPLEVCIARDPKGIYRGGSQGRSCTVPGMQATYEPPEAPDVLIHGDREPAETGAERVIAKLEEKGFL